MAAVQQTLQEGYARRLQQRTALAVKASGGRSAAPLYNPRVVKLRDEILQAQRQRGQLLKWKLLLVAGLGGAALGLGGETQTSRFHFLLFLVPLFCSYADILCRHLNLRILVIARYLRSAGPAEWRAYEEFAAKAREVDAYRMEDWALEYSTRVLCVLIGLFGVCAAEPPISWLLLAAAIFGLALSAIEGRAYRRRADGIAELT